MKIEDIKSFLKQNKITYEKLSELSGISISALKKIFSGQAKYPRVDTVEATKRLSDWTKSLTIGMCSPRRKTS